MTDRQPGAGGSNATGDEQLAGSNPQKTAGGGGKKGGEKKTNPKPKSKKRTKPANAPKVSGAAPRAGVSPAGPSGQRGGGRHRRPRCFDTPERARHRRGRDGPTSRLLAVSRAAAAAGAPGAAGEPHRSAPRRPGTRRSGPGAGRAGGGTGFAAGRSARKAGRLRLVGPRQPAAAGASPAGGALGAAGLPGAGRAAAVAATLPRLASPPSGGGAPAARQGRRQPRCSCTRRPPPLRLPLPLRRGAFERRERLFHGHRERGETSKSAGKGGKKKKN